MVTFQSASSSQVLLLPVTQIRYHSAIFLDRNKLIYEQTINDF
jgi:hypothetical protein